jgi:dihydrofolate reductase
MIKVSMATGLYGEFGCRGRLPWQGHPYQHKDFEAFREFTKGCILVMGRHTFESLPCNLPNRYNVVVTRGHPLAKDGSEADMYRPLAPFNLKSLCKSLQLQFNRDVVVIGGSKLIQDALRFADQVLHTSFQDERGYECDVSIELGIPIEGKLVKYECYGKSNERVEIMEYKRGEELC